MAYHARDSATYITCRRRLVAVTWSWIPRWWPRNLNKTGKRETGLLDLGYFVDKYPRWWKSKFRKIFISCPCTLDLRDRSRFNGKCRRSILRWENVSAADINELWMTCLYSWIGWWSWSNSEIRIHASLTMLISCFRDRRMTSSGL